MAPRSSTLTAGANYAIEMYSLSKKANGHATLSVEFKDKTSTINKNQAQKETQKLSLKKDKVYEEFKIAIRSTQKTASSKLKLIITKPDGTKWESESFADNISAADLQVILEKLYLEMKIPIIVTQTSATVDSVETVTYTVQI